MRNILAVGFVCLCIVPMFAVAGSKKAAVDPDDAYKNNCMRCHSAVRAYSPRMTASIVLHMRVRANMTAEETQAILQYLTESAPIKPAPATAYGHK